MSSENKPRNRGIQSPRPFLLSIARFFTFLDYDGVPWNNNNAEHAIKGFARVRRFADGRFTEDSIREYLVMLSVAETCRYQNIEVLQFLLAHANNSSAAIIRRRSVAFERKQRRFWRCGSAPLIWSSRGACPLQSLKLFSLNGYSMIQWLAAAEAARFVP